MAFIAGYVCERPQYASLELLERIRAFSILPGDVGSAYEQRVITNRYTDFMLRLPAPWLYKGLLCLHDLYRVATAPACPVCQYRCRLTGLVPTLALPRNTFTGRLGTLGGRVARKVDRAMLRRRSEPVRWLVLGDAALQAEVRERLHGIPALRAVLDVTRCDDFHEKVRIGVYRDGGHEEILGGLTSLCQAAETLP